MLQDHFSKFGRIENTQLVYDRNSGRSRGFAFIHYEDVDDAIEVGHSGMNSYFILKVFSVYNANRYPSITLYKTSKFWFGFSCEPLCFTACRRRSRVPALR